MGLFDRINEGLARSRDKFKESMNVLLDRGPDLDEEFWEGLEETLILSDVGGAAAADIVERLRDLATRRALPDAYAVLDLLNDEIAATFTEGGEDIFGGGGGYTAGGGFGGSWADILESIRSGEGAFGSNWDFGGGFGGQPQPRRGQDMNVTLNVTFDEAMQGTEKRITVRIPGKSESDTHTVKVPAGAVDGGRVRLRGQGALGENGGPAGDLLITTKIDEHPYFGRDKADVTVTLPVTVAEAALGASIVVPTPDGKKIKVKVPAGTQDGKVLTIKGKGAPDVKNKGQFGNLKIRVAVEVPTEMNEAQTKAMEDFQAATDKEIRPWD